MDGFEKHLKERLQNAKKVVVLCAGSELKADDAAGARVARMLIKKYTENCSERLMVLDGGTAPENFTGAIKGFDPDHIIVIDAADFPGEPGAFSVISPEDVKGVSFSTHMLPLNFLLDYIMKETGCDATIVGIRPHSVSFGFPMSPQVKKAAARLVKILESVFREMNIL